MDFDSIFKAYYTQYRNESPVPSSSDEEYLVAIELANEAIKEWAAYDGTYWKELWTTHQTDGTGDQTIVTGTRTYAVSTNFREAGGFIRLEDTGTTKRRVPIVDPQEAQFKGDESHYAYFTGDPNNGFTLHINPAPDADINGYDIEFDFYKKPTMFVSGGAETTEVGNPYFVVHRMLANRFRASRNWSGYQTAKRDADNALRIMQADNNSGSWANPWKLADRSGSTFGA